MPTNVRRIVAVLLLLVGTAALAAATTAGERTNAPEPGADSMTAPTRPSSPTDAVAVASPARLADVGQPGRSRSRWFAELLGALVAAVAAGRTDARSGRRQAFRATSVTPTRPALGRAPPALG